MQTLAVQTLFKYSVGSIAAEPVPSTYQFKALNVASGKGQYLRMISNTHYLKHADIQMDNLDLIKPAVDAACEASWST